MVAREILIVDDESEDLSTMKEILEKEGYKVESATDGSQALDKLTSNNFDLILIDIKMPTLSGYDLCRLLREKVNGNVKIVYISIVPEKEVSMENISGFIQKPFTPESFLASIKKALGE